MLCFISFKQVNLFYFYFFKNRKEKMQACKKQAYAVIDQTKMYQ